jgi:type II pantothenate kinase
MGHPANVDITVGDISNDSIGNLSADVTAANLSKPLENASAEDLAAGVLNMVLETVFALAVFAARGAGLAEGPVVLTGSLAKEEHAAVVRETFSRLHPTRFILPDSAEFAAAAGAALTVCV